MECTCGRLPRDRRCRHVSEHSDGFVYRCGFDTQIDQTLFRKDVLSFRGTYIHENNDLLAPFHQGLAMRQGSHHLNTVMTNAEYHYRQSLIPAHSAGSIRPALSIPLFSRKRR